MDQRPVFTVVMGCNGVGKSAWKRANYDQLPRRYFDQDSVAGGLGDWNDPERRAETRALVEAKIAEAIEQGQDFGTESTYSGLPGQALVERVIGAGYRVEGVYLGTADPAINVERIQYRVRKNLGHEVAPERIPERWRYSLSNLRRTAEKFDQLRIFDNSAHDDERQPRLEEQYRLERGLVVWRAANPQPWCADWVRRLDQRQESLAQRARKVARAESLAARSEPDRGFSR